MSDLSFSFSFFVVAFGVVVAPSRADHEHDQQHGSVALQIDSSHTALSARDSDFYLRIRIKAATDESQERLPLNLSLVFDRSGSMKEDSKIGYVRQAGHLVTSARSALGVAST